MKSLSFTILLLCFLGLLLWRCGLDENPPANPNNPNVPGTPVPDETRLAILEECRAKAEELNNIKKLEEKVQFVTWITQKSVFQSAGLIPESNAVYAVFTDGRIVLFVDTPKTDDPPVGGRKREEGDDGSRQNNTSRTKELPKSNKVSLYNGMGGYFADNTVAIEKIFTASESEYNVVRKTASIANLKNVSGDGVFYLYTHGGTGSIPILENGALNILYVISFWTTDQVSAENERTYRTYLDEKKLAYMVATFDSERPDIHYAITDEFIKVHWSFAENAVLYMDACESFYLNSAKAQAFRNLIMDKATNKKSTYIGWSQVTNEFHATRASQFVFDRLLGANTTGSGSTSIPKEDPIQRPFDLDKIFSDLHDRGFDYWDANGATLKYESRVVDDILLAPTIEKMEIDEYTSLLQIHGSFGSERGKVTVDDKEITNISEWSPVLIMCTIPETGTGSAGDVIVSVRDLKSNPVPLTIWDIKLNYASDDNGVRIEGVINLKIRSDVHPGRTKPGEDPSVPEFVDYGPNSGYLFGNSSTATYNIGGQKYARCNVPPCVSYFEETPLVKSGTVPYLKLGASQPALTSLYNWTPDRKTIRIDFLNVNLPKVTTTTYLTRYDCPDADDETKNQVSTTMNFSIPTDEISDNIKLEIADNYNIRSGSYSKNTSRPWNPCDGTGTYKVLVTWDLVRPHFAPTTDKTPARIGMPDGE